MMDISNEKNSVYIIDKDYRIIHFNRTIKKKFPTLKRGDICYKVLCGEKAPCFACPLQGGLSTNALYYNKMLSCWQEVVTGQLDFDTEEECHLVIAKSIEESNKNLFYNLTDLGTYERLIEINLDWNTYQPLYMKDSGDPELLQNLDHLELHITYTAANLIHPDDKMRYEKFWNLNNLYTRLLECPQGDSLDARFRKKCSNGTYRWVIQSLAFVRNQEADRKRILLFERDIDEASTQLRQKNQYLDGMTGLYSRDGFIEIVSEFLKKRRAVKNEFCMMALDIEHFKLFNAWYGEKAGDDFIVSISRFFHDAMKEYNVVAGHMGGDDFGIILPNNGNAIEKLQKQITDFTKGYGGSAGFLPLFGFFSIEIPTMSPGTMYDRAVMAMNQIKGKITDRAAWYNPDIGREIEEEYQLLQEVQEALENGEFTFYAQPKCNMRTKKIVGLEALVRWNHPVRGLIPPSSFIPVLERNGFITNLDVYLWDLVASSLSVWIRKDHIPVPISVNVSRVDIFTLDIAEHFKALIEKYEIPAELLEIEITESAYVEDSEAIRQAVSNLHREGFRVHMDDFGSGYSSLNMLKSIDVDVLKIDMAFLRMDPDNRKRGEEILGEIIQIAEIMDVGVIAEGVETQEQVDFLLSMDCSVCQGYYFYKPMSIEELEKVLADPSHLDLKSDSKNVIGILSAGEVLKNKILRDRIANYLIGGILMCEVNGEQVTLMRATEQFFDLVGRNRKYLEEKSENIMSLVHEADREHVYEAYKKAYESENGVYNTSFRVDYKSGRVIWLYVSLIFIEKHCDNLVYYGIVYDITDLKEKDQEHRIMAKKMKNILSLANINNWNWNFRTRELIVTKSSALFPSDYLRWFDSDGEQLVFHNFPDKILNGENIPFDQVEQLRGHLDKIRNNTTDDHVNFEFPLNLNEQKTVWIEIVGETFLDENGVPVEAVGYYKNVSAQRHQRQQLTKLAETDSLTGLYNRQTALGKIQEYLDTYPGESSAIIMFDLDNFKLANDVFGHRYGDSLIVQNAGKLRRCFRNDDIVCRVGGDEFLVFCKDISGKDLKKKLDTVMEEMRLTFCRDDNEITFTASAGFAMIPDQGTEFDDLYQKADIALYAAKSRGKSSYCQYDSSMKSIRLGSAAIHPETDTEA